MIAKFEDMQERKIPGLCGGAGTAGLTPLFGRGVLPLGAARVTLEPGCSCGEHLHTEDSEIFYVLEGELTLLDDGAEYVLHPGDCEFCPAGHTHGAVNRSDRPAVYLAVTMPKE